MFHDQYQSCIAVCTRCTEECEHCAIACRQDPDVANLADCIQLDEDCRDICHTAVAFMLRGSTFAHELCRMCAEVCEACAAECRRHSMEHCLRCAAECEQCAKECHRMTFAAV